MRKKKLSMLMFMFLASVALASMPVPPAEAKPGVTFTVGTGAIIPCRSVGSTVSVNVYIDDDLPWEGAKGMVEWRFGVVTDSGVLEPHRATGAAAGYYMYEFVDWKCTSEQTICDPDLTHDYSACDYPIIYGATPDEPHIPEGNWSLKEVITPTPAVGVGRTNAPTTKYDWELDDCVAWSLPRLLITLQFTSRSATAGTAIRLVKAQYRDANNDWWDATVVNAVYCTAEFPLGVEAAAAIGLMAAVAYVWLRKRKTNPTIPKRFITPTSQ